MINDYILSDYILKCKFKIQMPITLIGKTRLFARWELENDTLNFNAYKGKERTGEKNDEK